MQRRSIQPFNPKATITLLKEDPKIGVQLNDTEKRVLVDRYLEVCSGLFPTFDLLKHSPTIPVQTIDDQTRSGGRTG